MFLQVSSRQLFVPLQPINLVKTYLDSYANTDLHSGCITVSNSANPSNVYIGLRKHGKRFLYIV